MTKAANAWSHAGERFHRNRACTTADNEVWADIVRSTCSMGQGLSDAALQEVYRSVIVGRLLYAASELHRFTQASDRQSYCLIVRNVTVTVCQTYRHLKNYVKLDMTNSSIKLFPIPVILCTPCCHHHPQHCNITISGVEHTRILFPNMTLICVIVTF